MLSEPRTGMEQGDRKRVSGVAVSLVLSAEGYPTFMYAF